MLIRRRTHKVPLLNTTATADISFMLLIFFLVTTSMDANKGLTRQLPPYQDEQAAEPTDVDANLLLRIQITDDGRTMVNDSPADDRTLLAEVKEKIRSAGKEHIISIECDPNATYEAWFHLQEQVLLAYKELRNEAAKKQFRKLFSECNEQQRKAITDAIPQRIAEAYPQQEEGGRP